VAFVSIRDLESTRELGCVVCARTTLFEQPPGTGEYDEWACTVCGAAIMAGDSPLFVEQADRTAHVKVHRAA